MGEQGAARPRAALGLKCRERAAQAGGSGGGVTPGPVPNPEVKPARAEGTAGAARWETRAPPPCAARSDEAPSRGFFRLYGLFCSGPCVRLPTSIQYRIVFNALRGGRLDEVVFQPCLFLQLVVAYFCCLDWPAVSLLYRAFY